MTPAQATLATVSPTPPADAAPAPSAAVGADPLACESPRDRLRRRLIETTAELCAARGHRRVALCGHAPDLWPIVRQPWLWHNLQTVALLSDDDAPPYLRGVPVLRGSTVPPGVDAVVICSEDYEHVWFDRARAWTTPALRGPGPAAPPIDIIRPYFSCATWEPDDPALQRLIDHWSIPPGEAHWLVHHRGERHDATLPMLLPSRTELHLRRYEFAAKYTPHQRVADIACGLGYGARILTTDGAASSVIGLDIDPSAVAYASRRFGAPNIEFRAADAAASGLPAASVDVVTSFETIEHVLDPRALLREFARILSPGGTLVLSTPNDWGPTAYHVHSFTPESLARVVAECFDIQGWWTQLATTQRLHRGVPEGIAPRRAPADPAETLLLVARRRDSHAAASSATG